MTLDPAAADQKSSIPTLDWSDSSINITIFASTKYLMMHDFAVVTVRNSSTRLPNKAILEIAPQLKSIEAVIERAKRTHLPVVLATSTDDSDDIFEEIASKNKIQIFRGALLNKIKRWKDCFDQFQINNALLIDGDDLLYDYDIGIRAINKLHHTDALMIKHPEDIICGYFTYAIKNEGMNTLYDFAKQENTNTDVITEFIKQSGITVDILELTHWEREKSFRLTLDYEEDLLFFIELIKQVGIGAEGKTITNFLDAHPEIVNINLHRQNDWAMNQKKFNEEVKNR